MGRPYKQGMDFFPHDTDAASDEKIERMTSLYGNDGYVFCFVLLERIYRTPDARLDISDPDTRIVLADKCRVPLERWEAMLSTAIKALFFCPVEYKGGFLTSDGIKKRAGYVADKRESWRNRKDIQELSTPLSDEKTTQEVHKQHYTKLNDTTVNKTQELPLVASPQNGETTVTVKPVVEKKTDPRVREVIVHYSGACEKALGFKPNIEGQKDGAMAKKLLSGRTLEEANALVDAYLKLDDDYLEKHGYPFSLIGSRLNAILAQKKMRNRSNVPYVSNDLVRQLEEQKIEEALR